MKKIILIGLGVVTFLVIMALNCTGVANTSSSSSSTTTTVSSSSKSTLTFNSSIADSFSDTTIDKITTIHYECYLQGATTATVSDNHTVTDQERSDYKSSGTVQIISQIDNGTYSVLVSARDSSSDVICNWVKPASNPLTVTGSKTVDVVLDGPYGVLGLSWEHKTIRNKPII